MNIEFNELLLIKYFLKKSTEQENKCIYEWLTSAPEHKKEFNRLKFIWHISSIKNLYQKTDTLHDLQELKNKLYRRKNRWEKIQWISYTSVAAVSVIIILSSLFGDLIKSPSLQNKQQASSTEIFIPNGLEGNITLADGTKVWLNSGSRIIYPENYCDTNRNIFLDGEAYFEVKSDKAHPFKVETSLVSVIVTGTRFNLSSYADDNTIEATLCQGIITMRFKDSQSEQQDLRLNPNDKATYHKINRKIGKEIVNGQQETSWKDGILSFKEIPLREIVRKLERKFNVTIRIRDRQVGEYTYTATFEKGKGLQAILEIIATSAPISFQKEKDGSITILQT